MIDKVGDTPLIFTEELSEKHNCNVWFKRESDNPGGSSKDRVAAQIIKSALQEGQINDQTLIVEASSGNTAIGIALVCREMGLKCLFFISQKCSEEKVNLIRTLGADVRVALNSGGPDVPGSTQYMAEQYCKTNPNTFFTNQYFNQNNILAHFNSTGPEIWDQTDGKITHFICGIGTGGTISGVGRYLKSKNRNIKVIGVEPIGSILSAYFNNTNIEKHRNYNYLVEGIGRKFIPGTLDISVIDRIIQISDLDCINQIHSFQKTENYAPGFSSGAVLAGFMYLSYLLKPNDNVVLHFPDNGDRYKSKIFNREWLHKNNLFTDSMHLEENFLNNKKATHASR